MLIQAIENSFLLTPSQQEYLIENMDTFKEDERETILGLLRNEKKFALSLLKKYKDDSKNTTILTLKQEIIGENIARMRIIERKESATFDIEKELQNVI